MTRTPNWVPERGERARSGGMTVRIANAARGCWAVVGDRECDPRNDWLRALLRLARSWVLIRTVVLAEVAASAPTDSAIWHVLGRIATVDLPQSVAMRAGALCSRSDSVRRKRRDLTVDAIVAATAAELAPSVVITADTADLEFLVDGYDVKISEI